MSNFSSLLYLVAAVLFILALRGLSSPESARRGNLYAMIAMVIAVVTTLGHQAITSYFWIVAGIAVGGAIGAVIAKKVQMTQMPQLVAAFHSLVGLAAVFIATAALLSPESYGIGAAGSISAGSLLEMSLGAVIGAITFSGSVIAFAKLHGVMSGAPIRFANQHKLNLLLALALLLLLLIFMGSESVFVYTLMVLLAFAIGFLLIIPIGGADMPVVVSMLNSYSGWAAAGIGFTLGNTLLIIAGALIGASGAILSYIMCKAMNRSIINVIFGGFGSEAVADSAASEDDRIAKTGNADDAAFLLKNAEKVIIVPGYGMAVAQAQHALKELATQLESECDVEVKYAIHPVAGRMPGHMNVLLAEANVPYDQVFELDDIDSEFKDTDVVLVIGANDVTNPAAKSDPSSPIYGMPVLDVGAAKTVLFIKRSMSSGYAGITNDLFFADNTIMLLGDARDVAEGLVKSLKH